MGIHIHRAGCPPQDMCGCCDLRTRLDALYDRTHNAILSINGQTPDGQGAITLELLEQAAVQSIIDDHIDPLRDAVDGLSETVDSWNPVFEDYAHILRKVDIDLPDLITANHQYIAAVADDLLQNHYTKTQSDGRYALQSELDTYAKDSDLVAALDAMVRRSGNSTPQVITGTGGLMLQGDLSVGGDITGSSDTRIHFDTVPEMEVSGLTIRKDGSITRLSNANGISINGLDMSDMVSTIKTNIQSLRGALEVPNLLPGASSPTVVNKGYVESTDGVTNNLVHRTGNEKLAHQGNVRFYITTSSGSNKWREIYRWSGRFVGVVRILSTRIQINEIVVYGRDERYLKWGAYHISDSELNPRIYQNDDGSYSLWMKIRVSDNTLAQIIGDYIGEVEVGTSSKPTLDGIPGTLIRELVD